MKPAQLLAQFDRLSEAPDAIPRLRQFILDLAVRGRLVEQHPADEPAAELLKQIQSEKARLAKHGTINPVRSSVPARSDELAFEIRPNWQAARISQILIELQTGPFGSSLHQSDYRVHGIPVINPASIKNGRLLPISTMAVGPAVMERLAAFKLRAGDIVMGRRGEMGRCAVVTEQEDGWLCGTGSLILRLPECVFPRFLVVLIGSPYVREYLDVAAVGATMQNLNQAILLDLVVGLPPLAEQHRIVAKVDELMSLCDRLETAKAERESRRDRLAAASLHRLNQLADGDAPEVFREDARFYLNHLPRVTTRPDQIKHLRDTILWLAVTGRLSEQRTTDGSAQGFLVHQGRTRRNVGSVANRMRWFWYGDSVNQKRAALFRGRHFQDVVILLCVRWYLRYSLSYRDLQEMMAERGLSIDHVTIWRWVQRYAPVLNQRIRRELRRPNRSWRVDETYVKVAGNWAYLYRAVDSAGATIEFMLSPHRDLIAAKMFLRLALCGGSSPRVINVDGHPAYPTAVTELMQSGELGQRCRCRRSPYMNNIIEQDHRFIKKRITASLGFRSAEGASRTIEGYEAMHAIRKGQIR